MDIGRVILNITGATVLCSALVVTVLTVVWMFITVANYEPEPIESTRRVVLSCTVKSNIDGVITINDECKITVIGEE